jgi:Ran GTPase-activating protein (RanGAP) involved in mRNA processing and transport
MSPCTGLRTLNLRQNLVPSEAAAAFTGAPVLRSLEDLELRDNALTEVRAPGCYSIPSK